MVAKKPYVSMTSCRVSLMRPFETAEDDRWVMQQVPPPAAELKLCTKTIFNVLSTTAAKNRMTACSWTKKLHIVVRSFGPSAIGLIIGMRTAEYCSGAYAAPKRAQLRSLFASWLPPSKAMVPLFYQRENEASLGGVEGTSAFSRKKTSPLIVISSSSNDR
uniref:Uncharacterized protein n=1 Tax=Parascaris univalens TaxID=6257 RepID=A0A915BY38_PARUN